MMDWRPDILCATLRSRGKATEIGRFLGPETCAVLVRDLKGALWRVKNLH